MDALMVILTLGVTMVTYLYTKCSWDIHMTMHIAVHIYNNVLWAISLNTRN